ncbi:MAG: hypothetical protein JWP97_825 [Labilithrix sp.]|nr:hypothetical protein [Labilithrix sp.]
MTLALGVLAQPPAPGRCKPRLAAAHVAEWATGLYAAMLRDTLDGLQMIEAGRYVVLLDEQGGGEAARETLTRHVHRPWEVLAQAGDDRGARLEHAARALFEGASYVLIAAGDAPSAPTEPLDAALREAEATGAVLLGPTEDGGLYALGMPRVLPRLTADVPWGTPAVLAVLRLRCRELGVPVLELPVSYDVDEPSDVLRLQEELRKHPERAPRTAHHLVTKA